MNLRDFTKCPENVKSMGYIAQQLRLNFTMVVELIKTKSPFSSTELPGSFEHSRFGGILFDIPSSLSSNPGQMFPKPIDIWRKNATKQK